MRRFGIALLAAAVGYGAAALVGYFLTDALSSNVHDRAVEAAMSAAFVWGPLGAVAGFAAGLVHSGRGRRNDAAR